MTTKQLEKKISFLKEKVFPIIWIIMFGIITTCSIGILSSIDNRLTSIELTLDRIEQIVINLSATQGDLQADSEGNKIDVKALRKNKENTK